MTNYSVVALREVYEQCKGSWTGCDWTTDHGFFKLDLDGADPDELREAAEIFRSGTTEQRETAWDWPVVSKIPPRNDDDESYEYQSLEDYELAIVEELESAADWLDEVAENARSAEAAAADAMEHIEGGDLEAALDDAKSACSCEATYGDDPTWGQFRKAIEDSIG